MVRKVATWSKKINILKDLRQGDAILPVLFIIVLEIAVKMFKIMTPDTTFHKCTQILAYSYADDLLLVIMGRQVQDVEETINKSNYEIWAWN